MVKRVDLEKDAALILSAFQNDDYEIPTTGQIMKPIMKLMSVIYFIQIVGVVIDFILYNGEVDGYRWGDILILSGGGSLFVTIIVIMTLYSNVTLSLCLSDEVKKKSLICQIIKQRLRAYGVTMLVVNLLVGIGLLFYGHPWISTLSVSWFVTIMIAGITFNFSMSPYLTPAVTATLAKIHEVISSPSTEKTA